MRGLIQITGYDNYVACSIGLGIDCITNPRILSEPEYAAKSAGWFWSIHKLNELADKGEFVKITKVINGGTNGVKDRLQNYSRCRKVLECE